MNDKNAQMQKQLDNVVREGNVIDEIGYMPLIYCP